MSATHEQDLLFQTNIPSVQDKELLGRTTESNLTRSPREIIDEAIEENRVGELLLYSFAVTLILSGAFVLIYSAITQQGWLAFAGSISTAFYYPAMAEARKIRREKIMIRLLEAALSRADSAAEAVDAIKLSFLHINTESTTPNPNAKKGVKNGR